VMLRSALVSLSRAVTLRMPLASMSNVTRCAVHRASPRRMLPNFGPAQYPVVAGHFAYRLVRPDRRDHLRGTSQDHTYAFTVC
jgi:hypothetical protein